MAGRFAAPGTSPRPAAQRPDPGTRTAAAAPRPAAKRRGRIPPTHTAAPATRPNDCFRSSGKIRCLRRASAARPNGRGARAHRPRHRSHRTDRRQRLPAPARARGDDVRRWSGPGARAGRCATSASRSPKATITSAADVLAAAKDAEFVVHSAAVLGGANQDPGEHARVNTGGLGHILDAAAHVGARRVVALGTTTYFDYTDRPLSEQSPVLDDPPGDPYSVSKKAAFVEVMRRAAEGLDACVVIPGGTFGPPRARPGRWRRRATTCASCSRSAAASTPPCTSPSRGRTPDDDRRRGHRRGARPRCRR
ncbi:NAD-dependent epimerase/dehydratase family protein [Yinghuangia aomiensis]